MFQRPEQAEIEKDDPWADDLLERKEIAHFLESYLEGSPGFVLNVDAEWGSGKTFFMKRWANDVASRHPALYFNAWESDTSDDPFIAFVAEISAQLRGRAGEEMVKRLTTVAGRVMTSAVPILLKAAVRKAVGETSLEELQQKMTEDLAEKLGSVAEIAMQEYSCRKDSVEGFRIQLQEVVDQSGNGPLFIFVDELDRCRPTFAISLLETIKHLFSVPNVVFVVATDTKQLASAVCAVYGEGFDGNAYLRRFFDQSYALPEAVTQRFCDVLVRKHPLPEERGHKYAHSIGLRGESGSAAGELGMICAFFDLPLRDIEQVYLRARAAVYAMPDDSEILFPYLVFLAIARLIDGGLYEEFRGNATLGGELVSRLIDATSSKNATRATEHPLIAPLGRLLVASIDIYSVQEQLEKAESTGAGDPLSAHVYSNECRFLEVALRSYHSISIHPAAMELAHQLNPSWRRQFNPRP